MRPKKEKCISFSPSVKFFKPAGIPLREIEHIHISKEEIEALRLSNMEDFTQATVAKKMKIHQSTVQRLLKSARKKITIALVTGKAICLREGECHEENN